jgi:hypothetical protein
MNDKLKACFQKVNEIYKNNIHWVGSICLFILHSFSNPGKKAQNRLNRGWLVWNAFKSTATVQLAMIAYYTGSIVNRNQEKNEIVGNEQASALQKREYRGKYEHPG